MWVLFLHLGFLATYRKQTYLTHIWCYCQRIYCTFVCFCFVFVFICDKVLLSSFNQLVALLLWTLITHAFWLSHCKQQGSRYFFLVTSAILDQILPKVASPPCLSYNLSSTNIFQRGYFVNFRCESPLATLYCAP